MFASNEVATSFPSLTAIKGYDLDKSSDVPLMGHLNYVQCCSTFIKLWVQSGDYQTDIGKEGRLEPKAYECRFP